MARDKKSVLVYTDWISTFEELEDSEAGVLIKHFFRYVNDLDPEYPDRLTKLLFEPIKQSLKRDLVKYEQIRAKNRENANIRWDKNNAVACDRMPLNANNADSDNDNVSDIDIEKKEGDIYISRDHLSITWGEMNKLIDLYGDVVASDTITNILNYRKNVKYKSLYLTAIKWIKRDIKDRNEKIEQNSKQPKLSI